MSDDLRIRRGTPDDEARIVDLLGSSLGWVPDGQHADFYRWKHVDNAFGPSPVWLAETADGTLAGVRILMRWAFHDGRRVHHAVRAVDTATDPAFRGQGIFTRLTMAGVEDLTADGVDFVFNTPNDQSRPGYLKMGWEVLGRVGVAIRPRRPWSLATIARSRTAAGKWGVAQTAFPSASEAFADDDGLDELLGHVGRPVGLSTERTPAFLRWRYGFGPLQYAVATDGPLADGAIVFRLRTRGASLEATVCDELFPADAPTSRRRRLRAAILERTGADYAIATAPRSAPAVATSGLVPIPSLGPVLTRRSLASSGPASLDDLALTLGDVELF